MFALRVPPRNTLWVAGVGTPELQPPGQRGRDPGLLHARELARPAVTESVIALAVTFSVRRYRNKVNFGLAVQVWLLTSVLLTLYIQ